MAQAIFAWLSMWNRAETLFEQGNLNEYSQVFKCPNVILARKGR